MKCSKIIYVYVHGYNKKGVAVITSFFYKKFPFDNAIYRCDKVKNVANFTFNNLKQTG